MNNLSAALRTLLRHVLRPACPAPSARAQEASFSLFHHWLAYAGLLMFAAFLLWQHAVWTMLSSADPTGITLIIIAIFVAATLWCGNRALFLCREAASLDAWRMNGRSIDPKNGGVIQAYLSMRLHSRAPEAPDAAPPEYLADILSEGLHGPSEPAWWLNGIQIKLGLLGKVIGFSILALQISSIESFDPSQSQALLRSLTGGLGIALLTTAVGLVANMLLGLQLVRIDRFADRLLADTLAYAGHHGWPAAERAVQGTEGRAP